MRHVYLVDLRVTVASTIAVYASKRLAIANAHQLANDGGGDWWDETSHQVLCLHARDGNCKGMRIEVRRVPVRTTVPKR